MRLSDVAIITDPTFPQDRIGVGYVSYTTLHNHVTQDGLRLEVRRHYNVINERLDFAEQLPGWQQFARARQGIE